MLERERFDVLHDHGDGTLAAFADRLRVAVVHTLHGPFDEESSAFYGRHGECVSLVALSRARRRWPRRASAWTTWSRTRWTRGVTTLELRWHRTAVGRRGVEMR